MKLLGKTAFSEYQNEQVLSLVVFGLSREWHEFTHYQLILKNKLQVCFIKMM